MTDHAEEEQLQAVAERVSSARRLVAFTGAGASAESGLPTFRGGDGYWRNLFAEELATPEGFAANPQLVWEWYVERRTLLRKAQPNPGHLALVRLEKKVPELTVVTQNVDDLHERAGSGMVVHLHGRITYSRCTAGCGTWDHSQMDYPALPPRCECGALLRPDVVWFGEPLPLPEWQLAEEAARNCDVMLCIGTSAIVYPAAWLPEIAGGCGAFLVVVNPEVTPPTTAAQVFLKGPAGEWLPRLAQACGA